MKYKIKQGVLAVLCVISVFAFIIIPSGLDSTANVEPMPLGVVIGLEVIALSVFAVCMKLGGWTGRQGE